MRIIRALTRKFLLETPVKHDARRLTRAYSARWSDAAIKHDVRRLTRVGGRKWGI